MNRKKEITPKTIFILVAKARKKTKRETILQNIRALAQELGIDQVGIDIRDICNSELGE